MHVQGLGPPLLISRLSPLGADLTTQAVRIRGIWHCCAATPGTAYRYLASIARVAAALVSVLRDGCLSWLASHLPIGQVHYAPNGPGPLRSGSPTVYDSKAGSWKVILKLSAFLPLASSTSFTPSSPFTTIAILIPLQQHRHCRGIRGITLQPWRP